MKTALQELREWVITNRNEAHVNCLDEFKNAMNQCLNNIDRLLEKEKQQITEAYDSGWNNGYRKAFDGGKKYYETTYQNTP
jgi:hypothetical protein